MTLCILGIINTNSQKQPGQWSHGQGLIKNYEILRNKLKYIGQANLPPFDPNNLFKTKADLSHLRCKKILRFCSYASSEFDDSYSYSFRLGVGSDRIGSRI